MFSKFSNKNNMIGKIKNTVCLTFKITIPHKFSPVLDSLYLNCSDEVAKMLQNRDKASSKYYKSIPCAISKSLITKYQKNKKLKEITNLVIPICGDKGKQIKIVDKGIRIPSLFKKEVLETTFPKAVHGFIRSAEFFKRDGKWFMSYSYNVLKEPVEIAEGNFIGVDRNSVGNVATIALPNGQTRCVGPSTAGISKNFRNRRRKLQKIGAKGTLKKIKRKQSRRTKEINHKVSRTIVNLAKTHRSAIVLEDLGNISKTGKASRYVQKSQWSFYQLETFIKYKAALLDIPICYVSARYTSQECNKCGRINKPNGKHYKCSCGYVAHRDVNAALNIQSRMMQGLGVYSPSSGLIDNPQNSAVTGAKNRTAHKGVESESSGGAR